MSGVEGLTDRFLEFLVAPGRVVDILVRGDPVRAAPPSRGEHVTGASDGGGSPMRAGWKRC